MTRWPKLRSALLVLMVALFAVACASSASGGAESVSSAATDAPGGDEPSVEETAVRDESAAPADEAEIADEPAIDDDPDDTLVLLSAEEIEVVLSGNTIIGNWVGEDYRQFFDANGITTYRPVETGRDSIGEWRVNVETGLYESLWNDRPPWEDYEVHQDGDTYFWTGQGVELSEFTVVAGNQLAG